MSNFNYVNNKLVSFDSINNSVYSLPDAISILTGKFRGTRRSWIVG